jgi:UDP-galactopyranose mutase
MKYLIVGSGFAGSVFAYEAKKAGHKVSVIEKRDHIGGNCYTYRSENIDVHKYGPHIFHTSNKEIWDYISQFGEFNNFINSPKAFYDNKLYSLPFNMNTFYELWGLKSPAEVKEKFAKMPVLDSIPRNLEEQALRLVGTDIYKILIKGYTEKQWGKFCSELPPEIIKRLPLRFTYNNNYFNDKYQGIPIYGYTQIFEQLLNGIDVKLNEEFVFSNQKEKIFYTGPIDRFFGYKFGRLEYRTLKFETETLHTDNFQGNAVINYTNKEIPYTRIIEHKHFIFGQQTKTIITREFSKTPFGDDDVYYPINTEKNNLLLEQYQEETKKLPNVIFAGRLGEWKYLDMDKVIEKTLNICKEELK